MKTISGILPTIHFYSISDEYGEFSNFAPYPIRVDGELWPTTEHCFQAQKFDDVAYRQKIRKAANPFETARLGRNRKVKLRRDWESVKVNVMHSALRAKFSQYSVLRELLLGTGDARLVEHTENDSCWGDGGNGKGRNMLGQLLMRIRAELREASV